MTDPHKIIDYIYKRLQIKYNAKDYIPNEKDIGLNKRKWVHTFLLTINIEDENYDLIMAFPIGFPYKYPQIYLHHNHKDLIKLPHIDKKYYICTFDKEDSIPNAYKPLEVCENVIKKATKILYDGIKGKNIKDYEEEFLAYWAEETSNGTILSIVEKTNIIKDICVFDIKELNICSYKYLVADNCQQGIEWLSNAGFITNNTQLYHDYGVYFPIQTALFQLIPQNNIELLQFLSWNKLKNFFSHLDNKKRPTLVVIDYKDSFFSFELQEYYEKIIKKGKNTRRKYQKGFRPGKQLTFLELSGYAKDNKIKRYNVDRFDKLRLFERGGEGLKINQSYKINLFGCGSIGSFLLEKLLQVGFNNFNIFDNDVIESENLARHICTLKDLLRSKVNALSSNLLNRFPQAIINPNNSDIYNLIDNDISIFNSTNLNIICVGNYNLELLITKLFQKGEITKPILILWVEPYVKAGHFIYITKDNIINYEELHQIEQKNLKYKYAISDSMTKKREAGCQSTYIPYGTLKISIFINYIVYLIQEISCGNIKESCIYRWSNYDDNIIKARMEKII